MAIYFRSDLRWVPGKVVPFVAGWLANSAHRVNASLADRLFTSGWAEPAGLLVSFTLSGLARMARQAVKVDFLRSASMRLTLHGPALNPAAIGLGSG